MVWKGKPVYKNPSFQHNTTSVYKNVYSVFSPFGLEKAVFYQLLQEDSSQAKKTTKQKLPCVFSGKLKSLWFNYKCERRDHCSFGHHSITVTVERWDEFHIFDGKFENVRYNPIGKKIGYDLSAFSAPSFMLLEVTLLTKPFSLFSSVFCCFASTRSFTKQDILTSNRLYLLRLFAYFRNPQKSIVHPQTFILENRK